VNDIAGQSRVAALRELHRTITGLHARRTLKATSQAVVDAVVEAVGFGVAALSIARPNGEFRTVAVAGSEAARQQLLGTERPRSAYEEEFALAHDWGSLKFVPHEHFPDAHRRGWIPDFDVTDDGDAWHPLDALYAPLNSSSGELIGVLSVDLPFDGRQPSGDQQDLLELLASQAAIALDNARLTEQFLSQAELFRQAFDLAGGGMALVAVDGPRLGRFQRVNTAMCQLLGREPDDLLSLSPAEITHPDDRGEDERLVADLLAGTAFMYRREKRYLRADGSVIWVAVTATVNRAQDGTPRYVVSQVEDITGRRAEHQRLHYLSRHDSLTGLANRAAVVEHLIKAIATAQNSGRPGVVLYLDLDDFKTINDDHGHHVGDYVLTELADRIRSSLRPSDFVGRVGGDEFVIIADDRTPQQADQMAARIREIVCLPVPWKDLSLAVTVSAGFCTISVVDADHEAILRRADRDMYKHKRRVAG
jgi:diguanylate cyclase (GGDEF)-like protein/PAS domain S-box-containing protein